MPETVYLIDVYSLVFQVFHAIPEMTSPRGLPTNAAFGFTRDILNILREKKPDHLICAADPPGPVERETWYPPYKAERAPAPEALIPQFPMVRELIVSFGIPLIEIPGWEADDVLATMTAQAEARGMNVFIVSNDKDLRQLLSPQVKLYHVRKNQYMGADELIADWGVRPDQVIDYQSLVGDSVDNVPGVPLVGPKKASALLQQWGTLDAVLANADQAPGAKLKENLKTFADQARLSKRLVTLRKDLPIEHHWESSKIGQWNTAKLQDLFRDFGFRRFGEEVRQLSVDLGLALPPSDSTTGDSEPKKSTGKSGVKSRAKQRVLFGDDEAPGESTNPVEKSATSADAIRSNEGESGKSTTAQAENQNEASSLSGGFLATGELESPDGSVEQSLPLKAPAEKRALQYSVVDTPEALQQLVAVLRPLTSFCLDLETTGLDPLQAQIVGWAISCSPHEGWYLPVRGPADDRLLPPDLVIQSLKPILENPQLQLVNQNIKYDLLVLRQVGINVTGLGLDSMIGHFLLEAGARSHGLDELARVYFQHEMIPISALIGKGKQQLRMDQIPVQKVAEYAVEDAEVAWDLTQLISKQLRNEGLWDLYWELERPLISVLVDMQAQGIGVELSRLKEQSDKAGVRLIELEKEVHTLAGHEFNLDSPKQLQTVLFHELGLPVIKRTQTGASTDQEVLEQLASKHELPARMLDYRMLTKLKGTYLDALPEMVNPQTKRLHCSFSQVAASTGRLSASEPNLQNVPIRTPEGRLIRRAFVASEPGWCLLCADYSQIELRMLAHFCQDAALVDAFERGVDVHTAVAAQVFGVAPDSVDEGQRRMAKAVNFGVIYGQSPFGLAAQLQIPKSEAARFIDEYFAKYSGVDAYLTRVLEECAKSGYATTILGRRRRIDGIRTGDEAKRAGRQRNLAERTAINTVIQGSAADLIKKAMLTIHDRLKQRQEFGRMLLQIHDELVFETPRDNISELAREVRDAMVNAIPLSVPLQVDISAGDNWLDQDSVELS